MRGLACKPPCKLPFIMATVRNFETILSGLNHAGDRYVVVGGLATVLHGHPRFTADIIEQLRREEK